MNDEREVFRGHLDECVKHLAARLHARMPAGSKGISKARLPIAAFCGVKEETVKQWLDRSDVMPTGTQRLKLLCFLDLQGYRVIEVERMKKGRRGFCELMVYGLLSTEQASQLLGYKKPWTLYAVLQGKEGASEEKEQKMWDAWKERKEELAKKKEEARSRFRLDWLEEALTSAKKPAVEPTVAHRLSARSSAALNIMKGLLTLLEDGGFKELSAQELTTLHRTGGETILRLSAQLSTLSSKLLLLEQRQRKGGG